MKRLIFTIDINASAQKVYEAMLGLHDKSQYEAWTYAFNPTSSYEGNWQQGSKMYFMGVDENGNKGGMISEITEHIPAKVVSIRHIGMLEGDKEITSGEQVEAWAGSMEIYKFEENNGKTKVTVELDTVESFAEYFTETYPKGLELLKEISEK